MKPRGLKPPTTAAPVREYKQTPILEDDKARFRARPAGLLLPGHCTLPSTVAGLRADGPWNEGVKPTQHQVTDTRSKRMVKSFFWEHIMQLS